MQVMCQNGLCERGTGQMPTGEGVHAIGSCVMHAVRSVARALRRLVPTLMLQLLVLAAGRSEVEWVGRMERTPVDLPVRREHAAAR